MKSDTLLMKKMIAKLSSIEKEIITNKKIDGLQKMLKPR